MPRRENTDSALVGLEVPALVSEINPGGARTVSVIEVMSKPLMRRDMSDPVALSNDSVPNDGDGDGSEKSPKLGMFSGSSSNSKTYEDFELLGLSGESLAWPSPSTELSRDFPAVEKLEVMFRRL